MGYFGATHHAIEDIAILRGMPHLTIASAADNAAMRSLMRAGVADGLPLYIRAPSSLASDVYPGSPDFVRGAAHIVAKGRDVVLIGTGLGTTLCAQAAAVLKASGVSATVVDMAFLKPFDGGRFAALPGMRAACSWWKNTTPRRGWHRWWPRRSGAAASRLAWRRLACRMVTWRSPFRSSS